MERQYSALRIIGLSLSVLSFGFAIAFGGYTFYKQQEEKIRSECVKEIGSNKQNTLTKQQKSLEQCIKEKRNSKK